MTEQTSIVYTADQVEQIVELLFQKFTQHISSPTAAYLDSSISQQPMPDTKLTLSVNEAAKMIGISKPKVYDLIREGSLLSIHVGKKIVIPKQAVLQSEKGRYVLVKAGENTYVRRFVEVQSIDEHFLRVIKGLNKGDVIVKEGAFYLIDKH